MQKAKVTAFALASLAGLAIVALRCELAAAGESAALKSARETERALIETIAKARPAFVFIGGGSGVLISADGLMLTNHHVAVESKRWRVRVGNRRYTANVVGSDPRGDVALLKLKDAAGLPFVEFADSDKLAVGQQVIAIGNPFNTADFAGEPSVGIGIVSALNRFDDNYSDAIQTDAPVNPGNSGGPLLTLDGKLAGINGMISTKTGALANTGIALAIPARQIQRFLPQLKQAAGGLVHHGFIRGLVGQEEETDDIQNGAEIVEVDAKSSAEKLGFKVGDRVVSAGGYKVHNYTRLLGVMGTYPAGSELEMKCECEGKTRTILAKLEPMTPGVMGVDFDRAAGREGPTVLKNIHSMHAAEKAGLKPGDVIIAINGKPVRSLREAQDLLEAMFAGDVVVLKIRRTSLEPAKPAPAPVAPANPSPGAAPAPAPAPAPKPKEIVEEKEISVTMDSIYDTAGARPRLRGRRMRP